MRHRGCLYSQDFVIDYATPPVVKVINYLLQNVLLNAIAIPMFFGILILLLLVFIISEATDNILFYISSPMIFSFPKKT